MFKVLIVDDSSENRFIFKDILQDLYTLYMAKDGDQAITIAKKRLPDLILLDVMMPQTDGYEVCKVLKEDPATSHIPIIFLTAMNESEDETKGLALGAVDYIRKPVNRSILKERVKTHIELKNIRDQLRNQNVILERKVVERTKQLEELQDVVMVSMGALAESRDNETGHHIMRTQTYIKMIAEKLKDYPKYSEYLTPKAITLIFKSAPLHDIGKVGIPDNILLKPGKLTPEEFEIMKTHTILGRDAILTAKNLIKTSDDFLTYALQITYSHHEKWDGTGYPQGLKGEEIPISARLMSVADVYDALATKRVYKPAFSHSDAVKIIKDGRGKSFDPDIVDVFMDLSDDIYEVSKTI